jgi:hypothetical protein
MVLKREVQPDGSVGWRVPAWIMNTLVSIVVVGAIWNTKSTNDSDGELKLQVFPALENIKNSLDEIHYWLDSEKEFHAKVISEMRVLEKLLDEHANEDDIRFLKWGVITKEGSRKHLSLEGKPNSDVGASP